MPDDEEQAKERVRRALGRLGADTDSAPQVPPAVTARIGAALRCASAPPDTPNTEVTQP
jgi:hypothetical protein